MLRRRGIPKIIFIDAVREDAEGLDVTDVNAGARVRWRQVLHCADPKMKPKNNPPPKKLTIIL